MPRIPERTYWHTTAYDRLDRMKLVGLMREVGYGDDFAEEMSRAEIIDLLLSTAVSAEYDAEGAADDYPLHRPVRTAAPAWLLREAARVHLRCERAWKAAIVALLDGDAPDGRALVAAQGDVVVTVLGCDPPLVAAVERVTGRGRDGRVMSDRVVLAQPVTWWALWGSGDNRPPALESGPLEAGVSRALLAGLVEELQAPTAQFADAGDCGWGGTSASAVEAVARLQAGGASPRCASCGVDDGELVHFERPVSETIQLEIQDHADDVAFVCHACHRLLHPHAVAAQRRALRPPCPECGAQDAKTILWGLLDSLSLGEDVVAGGCAVDAEPRARWQCRDCDARFTIITVPGPAQSVELPVEFQDDRTGRERPRPRRRHPSQEA